MIFASPAVQAVYEQIVLGEVIGDYQNGVKAFATYQPRNGYLPDGPSPKTYPELDAYHARVRVFEQGYDEAAQDERYKVLHDLAKVFRK
jgi:hypothetical protein